MNRLTIRTLVLLILLSAVLSLTAALPDPLVRDIQNKHWDSALSLLDKQADGDFVRFLKGVVQAEKKQHAAAAAAWSGMLERFPASPWRYKADFRRADALAQLKRFAEAAQIYSAALTRLGDAKRREEMARIYLNLGNKAITPEKKGDEPTEEQHRKAAGYFAKGLELGKLPAALDVRLRLSRGVSLHLAGRYYERQLALQLLEKLHKEELAAHPAYRQEAVFHLAGCYAALSRTWEARSLYYTLLRDGAESEYPPKAGIEILKLYGFDRRVGTLGLYNQGAAVVELMTKSHPKHALTRKARAWQAEALINLNMVPDAQRVLESFLADYPGEEESPDMTWTLARILRDAGRPLEALAVYRRYLAAYPASKHWNAVQQGIVDIAFQAGQDLLLQKKFTAAAAAFADFQKRYPLDSRIAVAANTEAECYRQLKDYEKAVQTWKALAAKYPDSEPGDNARLTAGIVLADQLGRFDEAFALLDKISTWQVKRQAQARIQEIKSPFLSLKTERLFAGGEKAAVNISLRNIKTLKVRIYDLNLNDYFRKTHSISSLDKLDIDLIKPDREFSHELKDYKEYKLYTQSLNLDSLGPGAWVIQCHSDTLQATTLLVISDLGLTVKASGAQLFALATDQKSGKPVDGVNLIFSDGKQVFLTGKTGADGIFNRVFSESRPAYPLAVFAWKERHNAAVTPGSLPQYSHPGQATLVHVDTDRPAYRPGDTLRFRVVLQTRKGSLQQPAAGDYLVTFRDTGGLTLYSKKLTLSPFGSAAGSFRLDEALVPGQGEFRILTAKEDFLGRQAVPILRYQPRETEAVFTTDKAGYFPGDKVRLTLELTRLFGTPAARSHGYWRVNTEEWQLFRTDDLGKKEFSIDTARYGSAGDTISVSVRSGWSGEVWTKTIPILRQDFHLELKPLRRIWISGEEAVLALTLTATEGAPKNRKLQYTVIRALDPANFAGSSKTTHATGELQTSDAGEARLRVRTDGPGCYRIMVSGTAVTGEPVATEADIIVPDEKGTDKVFFITETGTLAGGKDAELAVYSFVDCPYALLTVEQDRVLTTSFVPVRKGRNVLRVPVSENYAPACRINLTLPGRDSFHTADASFTVTRGLTLDISPLKDPAPGTEVSITIAGRDQNGQGRESELFVAVIDDALFSATGHTLPDIRSSLARRADLQAMTINSFTPFAYAALTKGRDQSIIKALRESEKTVTGTTSGENRPTDRLRSRYRFGMTNQDNGDAGQYGRRRLPGRAQSLLEKQARAMVLAGLAWYSGQHRTDADGKTRISFRLPDRSARWRVVTVAVDREGRTGSGETTFRSRRLLHLALETPQTMLRGDRLTARATVQNTSGNTIRGLLMIRIRESASGRQVGGERQLTHPYELKPGETTTAPVELAPEKSGTITITASTEGMETHAAIEAEEPGTVITAGNGGVASRTVDLFPDCTLKDGARSAHLVLRVTRPLDVLFPEVPGGLQENNSLAARVGLLLRLVGRHHYLQRQAAWTRPERESLELRISDLLVHLRILQKQEWGGVQPDPALLAWTCFALATAKNTGIDTRGFVPLFKELEEVLNKLFQQLPDTQSKAIILFALSWNKQAGFPHLNRLYRQRGTLPNRELALLTSALVNMDRQDMALDTAALLARRFQSGDGGAWLPAGEVTKVDWFTGQLDHTALGTLALLQATPASPLIPQAVRWLLARRGFRGWGISTADGLIPFILSRHLAAGEDTAAYRVSVWVEGNKVGETDNKGILNVALPQDRLKNGKNNVVFRLEGKGSFLWSLAHRQVLPGFVPSAGGFPGTVEVMYGFPQYKVADTPVPAGYSIIKGTVTRVSNELSRVATGEPFPVRIRIRADRGPHTRFLVRQILPPGCRLLSRDTDSTIEHFEQSGDTLLFWVRRTSEHEPLEVNCTLVAELPGTVTIPPVSVSPLNQPDLLWSGAAKKMTFLAEGADFWSGYAFTPDERYRLGLHWMEKGEDDKAIGLLTWCFDKYTLQDQAYNTIVKSLLTLSIRKKQARPMIRYFEILKERDPDMSIPLEDAAAVSAAYSSIGEHERAYQILAGILEARFLQESALSGAYQDEDRISDSVAFMERLFLEYPDHATQRDTYYSLGHQLYSRASEAKDDDLKKLKITRKFLFDKAQELFENYLLMFPGDQRAPETGFSLLSLLVEQEKYQQVTARSAGFASVHADSAFLDAFRYLSAYSLFFQSKFQDAIGFCNMVAGEQYLTKTGIKEPSRYRYIARHMLGKIYHSMQDFAKALAAYEMVKTQFPDAARSIQFLNERKLSIPEVTTLNTTEEAHLTIRFRGVSEVTMTVYKVDFLLLCMKEKDLSRITRINLAGIKPYLEKSVTLAAGVPYLGETRRIPVPVTGAGAYLVVLKANGAETSGMILRTDLLMDVLEITDNGIARISLKNSRTGKVVSGAAVNFISGDSSTIKTAKTDLRGTAETDGLTGIPTIVALADGQYAFFRGTTAYRTADTGGNDDFDGTSYKQKALKDLEIQRRGIQQFNKTIWDQNIKQDKKGLILKKAW